MTMKKIIQWDSYLPDSMKNLKLAIVDVETTGCTPPHDRVIEVGVLVIEKGRVVERFSSLVNPERHLPPFISRLTGIRESDLARAPSFSELEKDLHGLLKDCLFVAHNARFDYGFIQSEFERVGRRFQAPMLCTVRLSRRLFPTERRHGVDQLIERFGFPIAARHRALDDADILWQFLQLVSERFPENEIERIFEQLIQSPKSITQVDSKTIRRLPQKTGVYIFYNDSGTPLYVGKSVKIRDRVQSHFSNRHSKAQKICRQAADIHAIPTKSELGALLLENHLIKTLLPAYNQRLRGTRRLTIARRVETPASYFRVKLESLDSIEASEMDAVLGLFRTPGQAKRFMAETADRHALCPKLLGVERGEGRCFAFQLKKCRGACAGDENYLSYNIRLMEAFSESRLRAWPFSGPVVIEDGREGPDTDAFLVDHWCLVGKIPCSPSSSGDESEVRLPAGPYVFDYDSYKIFLKHLLTPSAGMKVRVLPRQIAPKISLGAFEKNLDF